MCLQETSSEIQFSANKKWREIRVLTDQNWQQSAIEYREIGPLFCRFPPPIDTDTFGICMSLVGLTIVRAESTNGGMLVHGALIKIPADHGGGGILLAGPGNIGKTTASRRFPAPWEALSDDASFIVRDRDGQYFAHPWPTWSRFIEDVGGKAGSNDSWNVQSGIKLRGIFFLAQGKTEQITPLAASSAAACLMEAVQQVTTFMTLGMQQGEIQVLHKQIFNNAEALVRCIPAYTLKLNLTGPFWEKIAEILASTPATIQSHTKPLRPNTACIKRTSKSSEFLFAKNTLTISYHGSSMEPILRHLDLLEISPDPGRSVKPGDIIYFCSPVSEKKIVHRVVRLSADGAVTRGDNNADNDSFTITSQEIIGIVTAAWRNGRRRTVTGGTRGKWVARIDGIVYCFDRTTSRMLHDTYHFLASNGTVRNMLPKSLHPRLIEFKQRYTHPSCWKLMIKSLVVGYYDNRRNQWIIKRPWKLVVDEAVLPDLSPITEKQIK
jgi:signal peptidase I